MSWQTLIAVGSGGFLGAIMRMLTTGFINRHVPHDLPFGTLCVNLIGSFILGAFYAYFSTQDLPAPMKLFIATGFLGAFTTYSTFALETFILIGEKTVILAFFNMALNVFGTVLAAAAGYKIMQGVLAL